MSIKSGFRSPPKKKKWLYDELLWSIQGRGRQTSVQAEYDLTFYTPLTMLSKNILSVRFEYPCVSKLSWNTIVPRQYSFTVHVCLSSLIWRNDIKRSCNVGLPLPLLRPKRCHSLVSWRVTFHCRRKAKKELQFRQQYRNRAAGWRTRVCLHSQRHTHGGPYCWSGG